MVVRPALALGGCLLLFACGGQVEAGPEPSPPSSATPSAPSAEQTQASARPSAAPSSPTADTPTTEAGDSEEETGPEPSDGTPRDARLSIPKLDIAGLDVIAYEGFTDDAPGTEIQDRGVAASPYGPRGGTGPGGIGNYQVTAHRLSSTQAFLDLPELRRGDLVHVTVGGARYTYRITGTRETSFRSPESLRAQRAAVPGKPGAEPTRAMISLSTCATIEDRAAGNHWADEFGNPEHRIDKIGVLVRSEPR